MDFSSYFASLDNEVQPAVWLSSDPTDAESLYQLGLKYGSGEIADVDYAESTRYLRLAAALGHTAAQIASGVAFEYGLGVDVNESQAVKLYRQAAEKGDTEAELHLGRCYENGVGVPMDPKQAMYYYYKAGERGHEEAQENFERMKKYPWLRYCVIS